MKKINRTARIHVARDNLRPTHFAETRLKNRRVSVGMLEDGNWMLRFELAKNMRKQITTIELSTDAMKFVFDVYFQALSDGLVEQSKEQP